VSRFFDNDVATADDFINFGNVVTTGEDISCFAWMQIDGGGFSFNPDRRYWDKGSGSGANDIDWMLSQETSTTVVQLRVRLRRNDVTNTFVSAASSHTLPTGWLHAGFTYDGSANSGVTYLDGAVDDTWTHGETTGNISQRSNSIRFANRASEDYGYDGQGAWFTVWDVALLAAEVTALNAGVNPFKIRPDKLLLCAPMWGIQSPEPDITFNAKSGTVTGAVLGTSGPPVESFRLSYPNFENEAAAVGGIIPLIMHHRKMLGV